LHNQTMKPRSPDFIGIGAQKAGTSWLRENLRRHPQVWMPLVNELHYFDEPLEGSNFAPSPASDRASREHWRNRTLAKLQELAMREDIADAVWWSYYSFVDRNDHWYRSLFALAPPGCMTGEITPRYMLCGNDEINRMYQVAPAAKIIFLLRHPVDRFWSQCKMKHEDGTLAQGDSAAMALFDLSNGRPRGEYSQAILRFCQRFPASQILLVFHEGIRWHPASVMQNVHEFLGLSAAPIDDADLAKPVNQSPSPEPMPPSLRTRVEAAYRSEMEIMAGVFGGYAASWLNPAFAEDQHPVSIRLSNQHVDALARSHERLSRRRTQAGKIFCVSMQRSGTTSVGDWFEAHGMKRAGSPTSVKLGWTRSWLRGEYDRIFSCPEFIQANLLEDDPWWCTDFFKILAERFPDAKFILLERDPDAWFESMCHSWAGRNPGWTDVHARLYDRDTDLQAFIQKNPGSPPDKFGLLSIVEHREHYKAIYRRHGESVRTFFRDQPERLFAGRLEDPGVFAEMCRFAGIPHNPAILVPRSNASKPEMIAAFKRQAMERSS
jgi:hypothetical protein